MNLRNELCLYNICIAFGCKPARIPISEGGIGVTTIIPKTELLKLKHYIYCGNSSIELGLKIAAHKNSKCAIETLYVFCKFNKLNFPYSLNETQELDCEEIYQELLRRIG